MTRRLTPLQAYRLGFRRGVSHAWAKMNSRAQAWEDEICELQDAYQALVDDVRSVRDEQAVKQALDERDDRRRMAQLSAA